jgi:hypothetical protein
MCDRSAATPKRNPSGQPNSMHLGQGGQAPSPRSQGSFNSSRGNGRDQDPHTRASTDIVQSQLRHSGVELEKEREGLANATSSAENGDLGKLRIQDRVSNASIGVI